MIIKNWVNIILIKCSFNYTGLQIFFYVCIMYGFLDIGDIKKYNFKASRGGFIKIKNI